MKYTLDRFEEEYVILENRESGEFFKVTKDVVIDIAKEGDILELVDGKYIVHIEETNKQKEYIKNLMQKLKKK